ncbi:MAG: PIN domain-containing protein [Planctomycetota bacterium]
MIDHLFFDTNVLLDHLLDRAPFADAAAELWSLAERQEVIGCASAVSFNIVYYIVRHQADERAARRAIKGLRDVFDIVEVDAHIIHQAIDSGFADFEDAIQHACALRAGASHLVTRDVSGFRRSEIPVVAPQDYLGTRSED